MSGTNAFPGQMFISADQNAMPGGQRRRGFVRALRSMYAGDRPHVEKAMIAGTDPVAFRRYQATDYSSVASLWTRINRELAPAGMEELFERYIATTIDGELKQLLEVFSAAKRNAFWVVEDGDEVVGSFGIESHGAGDTELRRMYLDQGYRGKGIAQRMLDHAEAEARALGFTRMLLSTAEIQKSAVVFYRKSGFQHIRTEVAEAMNPKQAGGGLTRFHYQKAL
ncbi:MAG: GNAT family N-acetyltransferase [Bradyrhizobium sp.]